MQVSLVINGKSYRAESNKTILQVCLEAGIEIPRFCYHEKLTIAGNCRMCLVEILYPASTKPVASCAIRVFDGMIIDTESNFVRKIRNSIIEFLLINHPLDCPICDQGGECDLQDQTRVFGSDRGRFYENRRSVSDNNYGPLVKTVMTRCIHCTRCVRFLNEIAGVRTLGMVGRGNTMKISSYLDNVILTELSGNIIDICPVGALTSRPYAFKGRPWELDKVEVIDLLDSLHANIIIETRGLQILRVLPLTNNFLNEEWISDRTRFFYDGLMNQRLKLPYLNLKNIRQSTKEKNNILIPFYLSYDKDNMCLELENSFFSIQGKIRFRLKRYVNDFFSFNTMHQWHFGALFKLNMRPIVFIYMHYGFYVFTSFILKASFARFLFIRPEKQDVSYETYRKYVTKVQIFSDKSISRVLRSCNGSIRIFYTNYVTRIRSIDLFLRSYGKAMENFYLTTNDFIYFFICTLLSELHILITFSAFLINDFEEQCNTYILQKDVQIDILSILSLEKTEDLSIHLQFLLDQIRSLENFFYTSVGKNIYIILEKSYIKFLRGDDNANIAFIRWQRNYNKVPEFLRNHNKMSEFFKKLKRIFFFIVSSYAKKGYNHYFYSIKNLIDTKKLLTEMDWKVLPLFFEKLKFINKKKFTSQVLNTKGKASDFSTLNVKFALGSLISLELLTFIRDFSKVIGNSSFVLPSLNRNNIMDSKVFFSFFNKLETLEGKKFCFLFNFSPRLELPLFNLKLRKHVIKSEMLVWTFSDSTNLTYFSTNLGTSIDNFFNLLEGKLIISQKLLLKESTLFFLGIDNLKRRYDMLKFVPYLSFFSVFLLKTLGFVFSYVSRKTTNINCNALGLPFSVQEWKPFSKIYNSHPYYTLYYMLNFDDLSFYNYLKNMYNKNSFNNYFIYHGSHNDLTYCNLADLVIPSASIAEQHTTHIDLQGKVKISQSLFSVENENIKDDFAILYSFFYKSFGDFKTSDINFPYNDFLDLRKRLIKILPYVEYNKQSNNDFYFFFLKFLLQNNIESSLSFSLCLNISQNLLKNFLTNFYMDDYICRCSLNMALISNVYYNRQNNFHYQT